MDRKSSFASLFCLLTISLSVPAFADGAMPNQVADAAGTAADQELDTSMSKMHQNMMMKHSGNADVDFVKSMLPHHQGAVDMAEIELKYGKDPEMRKMAEDIIKAQKEEISTMQEWLKKHGGAMPQ